MNDTPDPLDALLRSESPSSPPIWKDSLLARTTRTVRRRRRGRRVGILAALAACYVAGMVSMRFLRTEPAVEVRKEIVYLREQPKLEITEQPDVQPTPQAPVTALALEWQAAENPERNAELNRRAGDLYFEEENDWQSAVRCYKRYLTACADEELKIDPKDNWLLVTLKNARMEERRHAKNTG